MTENSVWSSQNGEKLISHILHTCIEGKPRRIFAYSHVACGRNILARKHPWCIVNPMSSDMWDGDFISEAVIHWSNIKKSTR